MVQRVRPLPTLALSYACLPSSSSMRASLSFRLCFWPTSFPENPLPDVLRAVQHWDPLRLTCVEKVNSVDVHKIHLLQIQSYLWSATLDLRLHLITVLRSKRPAQPNPGSALTRNPFNLESHASQVRGILLGMQRLGHSQFLGLRRLRRVADPEVSGIPVWWGKTRGLAGFHGRIS